MKKYIIDNKGLLNRETMLSIQRIVMMEVSDESVISESGVNKEINIDLDKVGTINPDVIIHIYNIVHARREALDNPGE